MKMNLRQSETELERKIRSLPEEEPSAELFERILYDFQSEKTKVAGRQTSRLILFFYVLRDFAADHKILCVVVLILLVVGIPAGVLILMAGM